MRVVAIEPFDDHDPRDVAVSRPTILRPVLRIVMLVPIESTYTKRPPVERAASGLLDDDSIFDHSFLYGDSIAG